MLERRSSMLKIMLKKLQHCWHSIWPMVRQLSGDDAYDRYLKHHGQFHETALDAKPALSRKAFFALMQDAQWKDVKRCC